jgi:hypothetical protein
MRTEANVRAGRRIPTTKNPERRIILKALLVLSMLFSCILVVVPASAATGIVINGTQLTKSQVLAVVILYGYAPPLGRYWYDSRSGAWGLEGSGTAGFILPGHNFGTLAQDASKGTTGVIINGRELNVTEALSLQRTFGAVYKGRWWLDGRTGYWGAEGNPRPLGNILTALLAQQRGGGGGDGDNFWTSRLAAGNSNGGCGYINLGDGQIVGTGTCR